MTAPSQQRASRCHPILGRRGAVAAAHPLAVQAGTAILAAGGSAVDAAIAAQAVICVVMPHSAGLGGDMLALVRDATGNVTAVNGTGRSSSTLTTVSSTGGASVTVPGLVGGWMQAHGRWGQLELAQVLSRAVELATGGYRVDAALTRARDQQRGRLLAGGAASWPLVGASSGDLWQQLELAEVLRQMAASAGTSFYDTEAATAMSLAVNRHGGTLGTVDFHQHTTPVGEPITVPFDGGRLAVQPPSSQGVLLALAAATAEPLLDQHASELVDHLLVEITQAAFVHRSDCTDAAAVLAVQLSIDPVRAAHRGGPRAYLHTAGVACADSSGLVVSSLVSVFDDFGSGVFVPELGFVMNNRAAGFTDGANAPAPGKRPIHTLAPAILQQPGGGVLALATPGADGQVQTLLQILVALRGHRTELAEAIAAPRWRSENGDLAIEADHPQATGLAARGHRIRSLPPGDDLFGAVVAAGITDGQPFAAADWRRQVSSAAL